MNIMKLNKYLSITHNFTFPTATTSIIIQKRLQNLIMLGYHSIKYVLHNALITSITSFCWKKLEKEEV